MISTGHLSVKQGKRVLVHMRSGAKIVARFKQRRARSVEFYDHDPILSNAISTLSIYRATNS